MSVTVADIQFEHHVYDRRGDVVYLAVQGYDAGGIPPGATSTPEVASEAAARTSLRLRAG